MLIVLTHLVQGIGFGVRGLEFRDAARGALGYRVWGLGFRDAARGALGFRVWGLGFGV
jgi:hypothetical protein